MNEEIRRKMIELPSLGSAPRSYRKCKICGENSALFDVVDFNKYCSSDPYGYGASGIAVPYYRCDYCDFTFTDFIDDWTIEEISRFIYNDDYVKVDPDYVEARPQRTAEMMSQRLAGCEGLRILDYGSGSGKFSQKMKQRGFELVDSYDPFSCPSRPNGLFDIIYLSEVIEHVQNPMEVLTSVRDMLSNGGAIIVGQSLQPENFADVRGNWWYVAPRNGHISTYSEKTFMVMAQVAGLVYYRGNGEYCFANTYVRDEIANALANFATPLTIARFFAPPDDVNREFHAIEDFGSKRFRWTAASKISWTLEPSRARVVIDLPFLMEIREGFAEKSQFLIDGRLFPVAVKRSSGGGGALSVELEPSVQLRHVHLLTMEPVSPREVNGTPDSRLLGLALEMRS